jgi:hypothetical protein
MRRAKMSRKKFCRVEIRRTKMSRRENKLEVDKQER